MQDTDTVQAVPYYRVSTVRQGESGLGLEAQRREVRAFTERQGWQIEQEFIEVESGTSKRTHKRVQLQAAIDTVKRLDPKKEGSARLVIYRLDRLSRSVHFLSGLLESGIHFVCMDRPNAGRFEMHILAAMAEEEARLISARTKAGLASSTKPKGTNNPAIRAANKLRAQRGFEWAEGLRPIFTRYQSYKMTQQDIADALNESNIRARRGGFWTRQKVARLQKMLKL